MPGASRAALPLEKGMICPRRGGCGARCIAVQGEVLSLLQ